MIPESLKIALLVKVAWGMFCVPGVFFLKQPYDIYFSGVAPKVIYTHEV